MSKQSVRHGGLVRTHEETRSWPSVLLLSHLFLIFIVVASLMTRKTNKPRVLTSSSAFISVCTYCVARLLGFVAFLVGLGFLLVRFTLGLCKGLPSLAEDLANLTCRANGISGLRHGE